MPPRNRFIALAVALCVAGTSISLAQERRKPRKEPEATSVSVRILAIRATRDNKEISPELKDLAGQLKQLGFTGFKLEKQVNGRAETGKPVSGSLIEGYSATVTPKSKEGDRVQLQVQVNKGRENKSNVTATSTAGGYVLYIFPLSGGDQLIVGVSAR